MNIKTIELHNSNGILYKTYNKGERHHCTVDYLLFGKALL